MYPAMENAFSIAVFLKNSLQNIKKRLVLLALSLVNIMTFILPLGIFLNKY